MISFSVSVNGLMLGFKVGKNLHPVLNIKNRNIRFCLYKFNINLIYFSAGIIIGVVVPVVVAVVFFVIFLMKKRKKRHRSDGMFCLIFSADYKMILHNTCTKTNKQKKAFISYSL